jgi:HEAT repeat protein
LRTIVAVAFFALGLLPHAGAASEPTDPRALLAQLRSDDWNQRRTALIRLAPTLELPQRPAVFRPLFDDPHYQVRETAIELLYGTRDSTLVDPLLERTVDRHPDVREAAVGSLHRFATVKVAEAIALRIDDPVSAVRRRAIAYFAEHDGPVARAALATALFDEDALNRLRAVRALAGFSATEAGPDLANRLARDPDPRVRREAARAFLSIDSREGLLAIAKSLDSEPDASVRSSFVFTLKQRTHQDYGEDAQAWLGWFTDSSR